MKSWLLFLLILAGGGNVLGQPKSSTHFLHGKLADIQTLASQENKLLLVHFSASWCMPCQWMEKNTFTDSDVANFLQDNYLSLKIDIDDPVGFREKEALQVTLLPSLFIFNASGTLLGRYEESMAADRLLALLRKHNTADNRLASPTARNNLTREMSPTAHVDHLNKPALIPEGPATPTTPAPYDNTSGSAPSLGPVPPPSTTLLPHNVVPPPIIEYGIQVGVYSTYESAIQQVHLLENKIDKSVSIFFAKNAQQNPLYKIVVGKFDSQREAQDYMIVVQRAGFQGYIKEWGKL